uniref:Uncharacterized protein n=1 Tax=Prolemur simus TaxID=1328070 RepID=A0A8C9DFY8_PROSS
MPEPSQFTFSISICGAWILSYSGCLSKDAPASITFSVLLCIPLKSIYSCRLFTSSLQLSALYHIIDQSILGGHLRLGQRELGQESSCRE